MSLRPLLGAVAAATAAFCLSCSGGGSNGSTSGAGSNGSSGSGGGLTAGLDGAWDITAAGDGDIGPSEMTIANGVVTGTIASAREGRESGGCTLVRDRAEFKLTFEGDALSGTITEVREYSGGSECTSRNKDEVTPVTGSRKNAGSGLSGEWEVKVGTSAPFVVAVDGMTAKAWDKAAKAAGREPSVDVAVAGGNATVTASRDDYAFAARRR